MVNRGNYEREKAELVKNKKRFEDSDKCTLCGIILVDRIAFGGKEDGLFCKTCWENKSSVKDFCCCCDRRLVRGVDRYKANGNFCARCCAIAGIK
jgi:hypothetical protein